MWKHIPILSISTCYEICYGMKVRFANDLTGIDLFLDCTLTLF